jgi:hypothetical protein
LLPKQKGGCTKGSSISSKLQKQSTVKDASTEATTLCFNAKTAAKTSSKPVAHGTFKKNIKETETNFMLDEGTLKFETIRLRILSKQLTAYCHQKVSPITEVEHLIVDCCIRLSKMGEALTKFEVMELADDILLHTIHAERLREFCENVTSPKITAKGK